MEYCFQTQCERINDTIDVNTSMELNGVDEKRSVELNCSSTKYFTEVYKEWDNF